jgi:hypothetical protein
VIAGNVLRRSIDLQARKYGHLGTDAVEANSHTASTAGYPEPPIDGRSSFIGARVINEMDAPDEKRSVYDSDSTIHTCNA